MKNKVQKNYDIPMVINSEMLPKDVIKKELEECLSLYEIINRGMNFYSVVTLYALLKRNEKECYIDEVEQLIRQTSLQDLYGRIVETFKQKGYISSSDCTEELTEEEMMTLQTKDGKKEIRYFFELFDVLRKESLAMDIPIQTITNLDPIQLIQLLVDKNDKYLDELQTKYDLQYYSSVLNAYAVNSPDKMPEPVNIREGLISNKQKVMTDEEMKEVMLNIKMSRAEYD